MRQYKIYNRVYKSDGMDRKEVTFGCQSDFEQNIMIGTSSVNLYGFAKVNVSCFDEDEYYLYELRINGTLIKSARMNKKTKQCEWIKQ